MRKSSQPALIVGTLALVASFMAQGAASQAPPGGQAPSPAAPAAPNPAAPGQGRGGPQTPQVVSPEVSADRRVTFRIYAPQADTVRERCQIRVAIGDARYGEGRRSRLARETVLPIAAPGCAQNLDNSRSNS